MQGKKKHEEMTMNIVGMTRAVELGEPCSFAKSCLTPFDPMSCSMPGFPVLHHLPELLKLMCIESAMPSNHLILSHPFLLRQRTSEYFPVSWLFSSGGQSIGASASASVLPVNIQGWFSLGLTE